MQNTVQGPNQASPAAQNSPTTQNPPEELAIELAQKLVNCVLHRSYFPIQERLKKFKNFFQAAYHYLDESTKAQITTSPAAEWLLDNFYVVEQAIRQVEEDMPADYYHRLPKTSDGWPRIQIIALALTLGKNSRFDSQQIKSFIQTFQEITPLSVGELWALPLMLRLSAMESLAEALEMVTRLKWEHAQLPEILRRLENSSFVAPRASDTVPSKTTSETMVANCILNLRFLATQDWKEFFESTSVLEKTLREDPADVYGQMDFQTRNRYRNVVEELARGSNFDEASVASLAVQLAQTGTTHQQRHVGYYLIGPGLERLEKQIHYQPDLSNWMIRFIQKNASFVYLGGITLFTLLISAVFVVYANLAGGSFLEAIAAGLLALLPSSSIAIEIINGLVIALIPPRTLPKLNFERGVPAKISNHGGDSLAAGDRERCSIFTPPDRASFPGKQRPKCFLRFIDRLPGRARKRDAR